MTTTIPAPFETPAARPDCPYEAVRLGVGLRFRDSARLLFLTITTALWALACATTECPTRVALPAHLDLSALTAEQAASVQRAALMWFDATDGGVDLLSGQGQAISVAYTDLWPERRVGRTDMWSTGEIKVFLDDTHLDPGTATEEALHVRLHELGHVLGLEHDNADTLMHPAANDTTCIPQTDIDQVCAHYSCGPNAKGTCQ